MGVKRNLDRQHGLRSVHQHEWLFSCGRLLNCRQRPLDAMHLIFPFIFFLIEFFLQAVKDSLVGSFSLAVGLRMYDGSESSLAPKGAKVIGEFGGVKLSAVIEDHDARDAKASDYVLLDKSSNFGCGDGGNGFSVYPFGEVVCHDK